LDVSLRSCIVSCQDLNCVDHSLEVSAETLYDAAAQALAAFRNDEWVGEIRNRYDYVDRCR
jgi:hypothetical protein